MKKWCGLFLCFLILFTGCDSSKILLDGKEVHFLTESILESGYQIDVPNTFLLLNDEMKELKYDGDEYPEIVYVSPNADGVFSIENTDLILKEDGLTKYFEVLKEQFEDSTTKFQYLTKEVMTLANKEVAVLEFTYEVDEKKNYQLLLYLEDNGTLIEINFSMQGEDLNTFKKIGKHIKESFQEKEEMES